MTAPTAPTTAVAVPDAAGFSGFGKEDDRRINLDIPKNRFILNEKR